ncbi:hypothetical protein NDA01_26535 [Trichocoleus desertorum AS-A10]|uniref:hypothetical protein n=1 Tax=Trichocoleus desertorum TaxID=1481672 RepID=UPI0032993E23
MMGFNPFDNKEQPRRQGGKMGGNFVENLGGDYIHVEGSVFNLQSDRDPLGQDTPRRTPPLIILRIVVLELSISTEAPITPILTAITFKASE